MQNALNKDKHNSKPEKDTDDKLGRRDFLKVGAAGAAVGLTQVHEKIVF